MGIDDTTTRRRTLPDGEGADPGAPPAAAAPAQAQLPTQAQIHRDSETARLGRADRELRAELTEVLNEVRRLEKAGRSGVLTPEQAERLRELRSRESRLHIDLSARAGELRQVRETEV